MLGALIALTVMFPVHPAHAPAQLSDPARVYVRQEVVNQRTEARKDRIQHLEHVHHRTVTEARQKAEAAADEQARAQAAAQAASVPVQQTTTQPVTSTRTAATPPPATSSAPVSGFQACVIQRESSGNPQASNGTHWGLYQMTPTLWALGGGNPADYGSADSAEQNTVFENIMANDINGGAQNWSPYDGC